MLSLLLNTNSEDAGLLRCNALTGLQCAQVHSQFNVGLVVLWWCVLLYNTCGSVVMIVKCCPTGAKNTSFTGLI